VTQILTIKNTGADGTWTGQTILAGATFTIVESKRKVWRKDTQVFTDVANGILVVGDGVNDITDVVKGWNWMLGDTQPMSDLGGKLAVHSSATPTSGNSKFHLVWTGAGDDIVGGTIGDGDLIVIQNAIGQSTAFIDVEFLSNGGLTFIHEGYARWSNGGIGDYLTARVLAHPSVVQTSVNLDLIMSGNYILPAPGGAGTGTHGWGGTPNIIPRTFDKNGGWDYDPTNGLQPNLTDNGEYHISIVEEIVQKYHNKIPTDGTCNTPIVFTSDNTAQLPSGFFIRITTYNTSDTVWHASIFFEVYREKTI